MTWLLFEVFSWSDDDATVDAEDLAGHERGPGAGEEDRDVRDVPGRSEAHENT